MDAQIKAVNPCETKLWKKKMQSFGFTSGILESKISENNFSVSFLKSTGVTDYLTGYLSHCTQQKQKNNAVPKLQFSQILFKHISVTALNH